MGGKSDCGCGPAHTHRWRWAHLWSGWWGWPQLELVVGSIAHSVDWPQRSKPRLPSKALNGCGVRAAAAAAGGGAKVNPLIPSIGKAILHSRVPTSSASAIRFLRFRCFSKSPPPRPEALPVTTQDNSFSEICVARSRSTAAGVEHGAFCLWGGRSKIIIQQFFFVTAIPNGQNGGRLQLSKEALACPRTDQTLSMDPFVGLRRHFVGTYKEKIKP